MREIKLFVLTTKESVPRALQVILRMCIDGGISDKLEALQESAYEKCKTRGKHTPGPWVPGEAAYETMHDAQYRVFISIGTQEAPMNIGYVSATQLVPLAQAEANAKLVAASPELLDACKHALFALLGQQRADDGYTVHTTAISKLKGAIKKAS